MIKLITGRFMNIVFICAFLKLTVSCVCVLTSVVGALVQQFMWSIHNTTISS